MANSFGPDVRILAPGPNSGDDHLGTVRIDHGQLRVHVLMYQGGRLRFRVNDTPMVVNECYVGGTGSHTIIGVKPGD